MASALALFVTFFSPKEWLRAHPRFFTKGTAPFLVFNFSCFCRCCSAKQRRLLHSHCRLISAPTTRAKPFYRIDVKIRLKQVWSSSS